MRSIENFLNWRVDCTANATSQFAAASCPLASDSFSLGPVTARLRISIRQPIHHLRKPAPVDALGGLTSGARPE